MNHPEIIMVNANLCYGQLLDAAHAHRLARVVSKKERTFLKVVLQKVTPLKAQTQEFCADAPVILEGAS